MGKGSKSPATPDPYKTAAAEAQFNRLDTYSPSGSGQVYGYTDPKTGQFVQGVAPKGTQSAVSTVESPWEKQIREMLQPASTNLAGKLITDNITNMPEAARVQDRGNIAQTIFDRTYSMLQPGIEKANSTLLTNLQARGIPIGGDAFNETYGDQQRQTQDTLSRLAQDADIAAGQEQSRQFGLDSSARQQSMAELAAMMGGGYNPPSSTPSGSASNVNYSGLVGQQYQNELAQYNQQQQQKSSALGTVGSLAGGLLMKCTQNAKIIDGPLSTNMSAEVVTRLPLAVWRYKAGEEPEGFGGEQHVGPMAEHFHLLTGLGVSDKISVVDALGITLGALQNALLRLEVLERIISRERVM